MSSTKTNHTPSTWLLEDLGVQARGDLWMGLRHAVRPSDGAEVALGSLSHGGFMVIDPVARSARQVKRSGVDHGQGWAIGQAPDGSIWQAGFSKAKQNRLYRWDWRQQTSTAITELPAYSFFTLDVAPDGIVYLPDSTTNTLYAYDPTSAAITSLGVFTAFGKHLRNICAAADGWLYITCVDGMDHVIVAVHPATGTRHAITPPSKSNSDWQYGQLHKDATGRVLVGARHWGNQCWYELQAGSMAAAPCPSPRLAATVIRQSATPPSPSATPLAFADGSYISRLDDTSCEVTDAAGNRHAFRHGREDAPLRIFAIISGGGSIWGGTFIPLTLFSHDVATGEARGYGNPTRSTGEIYGMGWSHDKLFMASYTGTAITRYTPSLPWQPEAVSANPVHLGMMKEQAPHLHRIYGQAVGPDGAVYFAAKGDYGCEDSGITRIDPVTDALSRWAYPKTTFGALCYLADRDELLVSECRHGEGAIRFTRISPATGEILASITAINDAGQVHSWLPADNGRVYGLHNHRATLFLYDVATESMIASAPELQVGDHCYNALIDGPDGRVWGLTNRCVYAVTRDLTSAEPLMEYPDHAGGNFYRFGLSIGPDGNVYFPNGAHLMRIVAAHRKFS